LKVRSRGEWPFALTGVNEPRSLKRPARARSEGHEGRRKKERRKFFPAPCPLFPVPCSLFPFFVINQ